MEKRIEVVVLVRRARDSIRDVVDEVCSDDGQDERPEGALEVVPVVRHRRPDDSRAGEPEGSNTHEDSARDPVHGEAGEDVHQASADGLCQETACHDHYGVSTDGLKVDHCVIV
ncbi:hypothetical protein PMKS-001974 [Pichia membranifaciens]|uniref:Uncharacterized protein n=1 Tax=Pichia membranifaciens TaxID=4926 RepID=A0A1Q2YGI9_9ASCO|nr:hypothetical protein PMKS-001974 [Pichia membranifaciens]